MIRRCVVVDATTPGSLENNEVRGCCVFRRIEKENFAVMYGKVTDDIIKELKVIVGENAVITEKDKMIDYSHDEFPLEEIHQYPEVVVKPGNTVAVSEVMKLANKYRIAVTPRGGATGLAGGCVPINKGIVLSLENMNSIIEVDRANLMVVSEAGASLMNMYKEIHKEGLFFPPHPGDESATVGGVVATNAGGARALKYGVIRNFIRGIEVVLPTGEIVNFGGKIVKTSTGYSLLHLMTGSEGTLGIITKATISLLPPPKAMMTLVAPFESMSDAIKTVPEIIVNKILPMAIEFLEIEPIKVTEDFMNKKWPSGLGRAHLMIIIDASSEDEIMKLAESVADVCTANGALDVFIADNDNKQKEILDLRSHMYEAIKSHVLEILDICVPPARIAEFVNFVHELQKKYNVWLPSYGHAGDGNVHTHLMKGKYIDGKIQSVPEAEWRASFKQVRNELHEYGVKLGGVLSGEHGVGLVKKEYLPMMFDKTTLKLMKEIKAVFDPNNILNPGKIVD